MEFLKLLYYLPTPLYIFCLFSLPILIISFVIGNQKKLKKPGELFSNLFNPIFLFILLVDLFKKIFSETNFEAPTEHYFFFNINLIIIIGFVNYYLCIRSKNKKIETYDYINFVLIIIITFHELLGLIKGFSYVDFRDRSINYETVYGMNLLMFSYILILFFNFIRFFKKKEPIILKNNIKTFFIMWGGWSSVVIIVVPLILLLK